MLSGYIHHMLQVFLCADPYTKPYTLIGFFPGVLLYFTTLPRASSGHMTLTDDGDLCIINLKNIINLQLFDTIAITCFLISVLTFKNKLNVVFV